MVEVDDEVQLAVDRDFLGMTGVNKTDGEVVAE